MQNRPRVSIVLPTYNGQQYLLEAISSCLLQTYEDLELIVVDDASTDGSSEIVSAVADPRIVYIKHETNRKLSAALNTGFAASRGEYLTWIADDNRFAPSAIQAMAEFLDENPDVDLVYTGYWTIDESGAIQHQALPEMPEMIKYYNVVCACFMYRRPVYEQIGDYNEDLVYLQDNEYWVRVAKRFKIAPLNELLYYYRMHENTQTREYQRNHGRYQLDIDATRYLEGSARRYQLSWLYEKYAKELYSQGKNLQAVKRLLLAFYYQPTKILTCDHFVEYLNKAPRFIRRLV